MKNRPSISQTFKASNGISSKAMKQNFWLWRSFPAVLFNIYLGQAKMTFRHLPTSGEVAIRINGMADVEKLPGLVQGKSDAVISMAVTYRNGDPQKGYSPESEALFVAISEKLTALRFSFTGNAAIENDGVGEWFGLTR